MLELNIKFGRICSAFLFYTMALLNIVTGEDNPILLKKSKVVSTVDKHILKLIKDMKETLLYDKGLGLAGPQVGENIRLILVALQKGKDVGKDFTIIPMINPEIISFSEDVCLGEEGCLSLPGEYIDVARAKKITVIYLDEKGKECVLVLEDINARIVQHEVDHLEGILITERAKEFVL